jgi:hypothetical protein
MADPEENQPLIMSGGLAAVGASPPPTPISALPPTGKCIQGNKYYVFSETGNIMISTTATSDTTIEQSVRDVFNEVSVFFSAMTKAITTTENPTSKTKANYSLYDYAAISKVVDGSGLFIQVTEEDVAFSSASVGATFSQDMLTALLGLATDGAALPFAQAMVGSVGSAAVTISGNTTTTDTKVCNIIFICEFLMGMPLVSVVVVSCDTSIATKSFSAGPCVSGHSSTTSIDMHKDTYLFVTPTFIKEYAGDLLSTTKNKEYLDFIAYLKGLLMSTT